MSIKVIDVGHKIYVCSIQIKFLNRKTNFEGHIKFFSVKMNILLHQTQKKNNKIRLWEIEYNLSIVLSLKYHYL